MFNSLINSLQSHTYCILHTIVTLECRNATNSRSSNCSASFKILSSDAIVGSVISRSYWLHYHQWLASALDPQNRDVSSADVPSTSPTDTLPNKEIVIVLMYYSFMLNVSLYRCLLHEVRFLQRQGDTP